MIKKKSGRRFIISINDNGTFNISTPDGEIDYENLLATIDFIHGILLERSFEEPEKDLN